MNTRAENAATASSTIAAAPAMARSTVARRRADWASRGLNGSAMEIGNNPLTWCVAVQRPRAPRQAEDVQRPSAARFA